MSKIQKIRFTDFFKQPHVRMGRLDFFLFHTLPYLFFTTIYLVLMFSGIISLNTEEGLLGTILLTILIIFLLTLTFVFYPKRLRDLNVSGLYVFIIPAILILSLLASLFLPQLEDKHFDVIRSLWTCAFIFLSVLKGTKGNNKFGPPYKISSKI